jgi:hypothetical protein
MSQQDDEIRFALGVIDDHRRLVAAGKTHRWDAVKWAVTVNLALAGASVTLRQDGNTKQLFFFLACVVFILSGTLLLEITRRMTAARDASLVPLKFLIEQGVDVVKITGDKPPQNYALSYDEEELCIYGLILYFLLWLF